MKKRIRMFLPILVILAMLASMLGMATPALASEITVTKNVVVPSAPNIYYLGETIYYEMGVKNPVGNLQTNNLSRIWDTLPSGTVIEFLYAGSPNGTYLIQAPGAEALFYANYTILEGDIEWLPAPQGYYGVKNIFEAQGLDSLQDAVYGKTEKGSRVIRPEIHIEKTVDFNGDGVYSNLEANVTGSTASWNVTVCNIGHDPVYNITVTDTNGHNFGAPFNLAVAQCQTFIYATNPTVGTVNNATAVGVDDLGNPVGPVSDIAEVVVVDARISIAPNATNPVGTPHTFTVHVEKDAGAGWVDASGVSVNGSITGVGWITSTLPASTDGDGEMTVTVNSTEPGTANVHAWATVNVGGVDIYVATNGYGAFTVDNEKTWVDARISIAPNATNPVGIAHTFTVTVEMNDGGGWDPVVGVNVTPSLAGGSVGAIISSPPYTTNGSGQVTVSVNSSIAGTANVNVSASVPVDGGFVNVATDGYGAWTVDNEKTWVDARISIAPNATNPVGIAHTFTVTVEKNDGGGWDPVVGVNVTPSLVGGSVGAIISAPPYTTNGSGQVTVSVNSSIAGTANVNVSASVPVDGGFINVATDGYGAWIVDNEKTWVDARISIAPNATNPVGIAHDFTVTVEKNDGGGWDPVVGVNVTPSLAGGSVGAIISAPPYTTNGSGQVTVSVNSSIAGTANVHASASVPVDGGFINVATDGYGAWIVDNEKTWGDARISIAPNATNPVGIAHTFTVTVEMNDGGGWDPVVGVNVTPSLAGGSVGAIISAPPYTTNGSGEVTVSVNSSSAGTANVNVSASVPVDGGFINVATDGYGAWTVDNEKTWVDARITIAPHDTNKVGDSHNFTVFVEKNDGIDWVNASGVSVLGNITGVGSITSTNPASTDVNGEMIITITSAVPGTSTVQASATVNVGGINITVATNGYGAHDIDNVKTWVDARISIVESGTNPVGTPHTFNVTVEKNLGAGWVAAVGVNVTPWLLAGSVGNITSTGPYVTDGSGKVFVTVNSSVVGNATVHASATVNVGGINIDVATNGYGAYIVHNVKEWTGGGGEGCTPGYWKNNAKNWEHSAWVGYFPSDSFETVFSVNVTLRGARRTTYPTPTLLEALDANGGGINALARHAVAALLNIANPNISYGIGSTAALITMVHDAIVSGNESQIDALHLLLAGYNEAGCPINQRGEPIIPDGDGVASTGGFWSSLSGLFGFRHR